MLEEAKYDGRMVGGLVSWFLTKKPTEICVYKWSDLLWWRGLQAHLLNAPVDVAQHRGDAGWGVA